MHVGHNALGKDKYRYLQFDRNRWRWRTTSAMRAAGFQDIRLSEGEVIDGRRAPTAADIAKVVELNRAWDRHRRGLPPETNLPRYPTGSIGWAYEQTMALREQERRARGTAWTSEHASRDDWPRAWKHLAFLGECDPKTVTPEMMLDLRSEIARKSASEAYRTIKVWRALWKRMAGRGLCAIDQDPSRQFSNPQPQPRQAHWFEGEAVRLVKASWRAGFKGLAACLAVAWDSQLSPVDARTLKISQFRRDPVGAWFDVARAKTGRRALATLSKRTERLLAEYLASLGAEPVGEAPVFRNRSGRPYSKDTIGDDFRDIREAVFGPAESRQMADFRRTGSIEALAGNADPALLSAKMANSLSQSNQLHKTYAPVQLAKVRDADAARQRGRAKIRDHKGN